MAEKEPTGQLHGGLSCYLRASAQGEGFLSCSAQATGMILVKPFPALSVSFPALVSTWQERSAALQKGCCRLWSQESKTKC